MSERRVDPATWTLATLLVCGAGLVWQAWAIRDLRQEAAADRERIGAVEHTLERDRAQRAVTAADRAMRYEKRHARRESGDGVDTLEPLSPRPADAEEWLDEVAVALDRFGQERDVSAETQDQVLRVYEDLVDGSRATRDHLAANHLTHAEARQQLADLHTRTQEQLEAVLGPEKARALSAYLPREGRGQTPGSEDVP